LKIRSFAAWKTLCALLLSVLFLCASADAFADISYTVRKGDTLSGIAHRYKVSVRAIRRINKGAAKRLRPGLRIAIPVKNGTVGKGVDKVAETEETVLNGKPVPGEYSNGNLKSVRQTASDLFHTVKKGDSLSSIARKYSVTVADLKELNGLRTSKLKRGQKLLIRPAGPRTYIVRRGDNLWKIARKFNIDPEDLMEINEMETSVVKVGQKLYLQETVDDSSAAEAYAGMIEKNTDEDVNGVSEPKEAAGEPAPGRLVAFARKLLNIPYKFGGNSILGIDCSAYVKKVYGFLGIDLPRTAREQFNSGEPIDKDQLSVGDLVFFRTYASFPSHVGIYIGNNLFIHASSKGRKVTISSLETPYFLKRFIGAKRLLTEGLPEGLSDADGGVSGGPAEEVH
jgi:peptidoglycan DL-endopeptidase LytE